MRWIDVQPIDMTPETMECLEQKGLIIRLCPNREMMEAPEGETTWRLMYEPLEGYGPHRLIAIRVNRVAFAGFGTHPDNEEFWLIGSDETQPMYLAIALISREKLKAKIANDTLQAEDFVMLRVKYNDPQTSFFIMRAGVPHGEAIIDCKKPPAAFYVTESRDLPLELIDFGSCGLRVKEKP